MSLDWNVTKVPDSVCFTEDGKLSGLTETLIFMTLAVGMGEITEDNWKEFYFRAALSERLNGAFRRDYSKDPTEDVFVTPDEVRAHIGLRTNVFYEPESEWLLRAAKSYQRELMRSVK